MANTKITNLSGILATGLATGDFYPLVDVSDTTMNASGTNKKIPHGELRVAMGYPTDTSPTYATPYSPDANTLGFNAILRMTMTGNLTLNVPTNGVVGQRIRYLLLASGADRTITLGTGLKVPDTVTFDGAVTSADCRLLEIEKHSFGWLVIKNLQFTP